MMRVQIDINDRLIGELGIHNTGTSVDGKMRYEVYDLGGDGYGGDSLNEYPQIVDVWHDPADGAAELVATVMENVPTSTLDW